jgi:DNA-binding MarR family transcriptional regulator
MAKNVYPESFEIAKLLFPLAGSLGRLIRKHKILPAGLTPQQVRILMLVKHAEKGLKISELSKQCAVTQGTMTVAIQRLVSAGLVQKERQAQDGRAVALELSKSGKLLTAQISGEMIGLSHTLCQGMSPKQRRQFSKNLSFVFKHLQQAEESGF